MLNSSNGHCAAVPTGVFTSEVELCLLLTFKKQRYLQLTPKLMYDAGISDHHPFSCVAWNAWRTFYSASLIQSP